MMKCWKDPPAKLLISVPKVKILQGVQMDPICPNLPIWPKINANNKS